MSSAAIGGGRSSASLTATLLLLLQLIAAFIPAASQNFSCPLDFSVLNKFTAAAAAAPSSLPKDNPTRCSYVVQALHLVQSNYLRSTNYFLPPANSSAACWQAYQNSTSIFPGFNLLSSCGFKSDWISEGCMNISTLADFDAAVPAAARADVARDCNRSLLPVPTCTACTATLTRVKSTYLTGTEVGNVSNCAAFPFIYAGSINQFGPADDGTAVCLFLLNISIGATPASGSGNHAWIYGVVAGCIVLLIVLVVSAIVFRKQKRKRKTKKMKSARTEKSNSALRSIEASTSLIKFSFDDIKAATANFSRDNIIGRGGYGNVYKGVLKDGTEVAIKRFKNCTQAGDASFAHEVEVIASVRHVNLVALRGYCTATTPLEGHQRIIVCDLMRNGSLHDHLFSLLATTKLSWPLRQKIAVGTARGLAYLHYGAQPAIMHRDIKASNILLDEMFEAKVADFGLAKFAPEGMTHVSTRVAGTLGYVAPEYALYGQLTERTDVYSFGVVLLELLSGKKAFVSRGEGDRWLITDWAWSLVRKGRTLDVIEDGMEELGPKEVMEKYVLVAVLASHPEMHARPTMDQILKILETDTAVPSIPDRPIPLVSTLDDIERSVSSSGSGQLSSFAGYQLFASGKDGHNSDGSEID